MSEFSCKPISELAVDLSSASRRDRQEASTCLADISRKTPELLAPVIGDVLGALSRKEARTRWECLDALTNYISVDSRACEKALGDAESSLYDESNGPVRLAAFRFLCKFGQTTAKRSMKVWPLIDEAIQCYHGDAEFQDMLLAVVEFSNGNLDPQVKNGLAERMKFDSINGKGILKKRALQIIDNVTK